MRDPFDSHRKSVIEFIFGHLTEVLLLSGVILLIITASMPVYERSLLRTKLTASYQNLHELVEALLIYSHEQPDVRIFPPHPELLPGINLCPIVDPVPHRLSFLTTPIAYVDKFPYDPFASEMVQRPNSLTPFVTHWIKSGNETSLMAPVYSSIGWGAFSIGPSMTLPPQYSLTVLRRVPYENRSLRKNLFSPSNGLTSLGLIYYDSLGNHTPIDRKM